MERSAGVAVYAAIQLREPGWIRRSGSVTCGQGNAVWWATPSDRNASAAWLACPESGGQD